MLGMREVEAGDCQAWPGEDLLDHWIVTMVWG